MKKIMFLFILLVLQASASAQTFAPIGAKWYLGAGYGGMVDPQNRGYYLYECVSDSFYEGRSCREISLTHFKYDKTIHQESPMFVCQSGDTVLYYNSNFDEFFPLYYLNVEPGDTLVFRGKEVNEDSLWYSLVTHVYYKKYGNDSFKFVATYEDSGHYYFHDGYFELFGSRFSLEHFYESGVFELSGPVGLRCYSDSDHFINFSSKPCDHRYAVALDDPDAIAINIFPVPMSDFYGLRPK